MTTSAVTFFSCHCTRCDRHVLGERAFVDDALAWRCLLCADPLDPAHVSVRWLTVSELELVDCFIEGEEVSPKHGEEGGCRGGTCGVQQPS
jgi:hypothetical protein